MKKIFNKKRVCIIGHFGFGENLLNGQTVKTKIITKELENQLGKDEVSKIDTHGGKKKMLQLLFQLPVIMKNVKNIIMMPAHNGIRFFAPLLEFFNFFFHIKLHYVVIGGWLPEFLENKKRLQKNLKKFDGIYVETNTMKVNMEKLGFSNIYILPNCKELKILKENELVYATSKPFKLCTFSRVMKEKGIEDAVNAVEEINKKYDETIFTLDIYGQIDAMQTEWFESLQSRFLKDVSYKGLVPFDKSTDVLKNYYALLFPTYYEGEGFAGTLIDAMAAGVPIIASDWRYNSEIVQDNRTGFLIKNSESLHEKLEFIKSNITLVNDMKKICIEEAKEYLPNIATTNLKQTKHRPPAIRLRRARSGCPAFLSCSAATSGRCISPAYSAWRAFCPALLVL